MRRREHAVFAEHLHTTVDVLLGVHRQTADDLRIGQRARTWIASSEECGLQAQTGRHACDRIRSRFHDNLASVGKPQAHNGRGLLVGEELLRGLGA